MNRKKAGIFVIHFMSSTSQHEDDAVFSEHFFTLVEGFVILFEVLHAFRNTVYREYPEQVQHAGSPFVFKCVAPCKGMNGFVEKRAKDDGVQERIRVIYRQ